MRFETSSDFARGLGREIGARSLITRSHHSLLKMSYNHSQLKTGGINVREGCMRNCLDTASDPNILKEMALVILNRPCVTLSANLKLLACPLSSIIIV